VEKPAANTSVYQRHRPERMRRAVMLENHSETLTLDTNHASALIHRTLGPLETDLHLDRASDTNCVF